VCGEVLGLYSGRGMGTHEHPLRHKAVQIPVFLVNEAQMDILYPPERRKVIDPENAKDWRERKEEILITQLPGKI
jgi:hypothetical protein